jgi:hypothetical protein
VVSAEDGQIANDFQPFSKRDGNKKARGGDSSVALGENDRLADYGAIFFIVGISPRLGLPFDPWLLDIAMVVAEVVPQKSDIVQ